MKPRSLPLAALVHVSALAALLPASATAAEQHFVNARLITMTGAGMQAGELLVRDGRIVAVDETVEPSAAAVRIDVAGGYLVPGLTEMHAHVPSPGQGAQYREDVLFLYVANGITTVRGMLGDPSHLELRAGLAAGTTLGPRLITSGPSFNGRSVSSPEQAAAMVVEQHAAGYDFLKVHPGLTLAEYDAMAGAARRLGMPFAGHVPADVGLLHALESGQATVDHLDGYVQALVPDLRGDGGGLFAPGLLGRTDDARIAVVVEATRTAGTAVVPTETLLENFAAAGRLQDVITRPQNVYLPRALEARYREALGSNAAGATRYLELRKRLVRALHDAGVPVLLGSDAPQIFNVPGFSAHRELAAMVAAGLSPRDALASATVLPARFFGREADFGVLTPGRAADIVWLRANPLEDIAHTESIEGVMVAGRWLDRAMIDAGLREIAERNGS